MIWGYHYFRKHSYRCLPASRKILLKSWISWITFQKVSKLASLIANIALGTFSGPPFARKDHLSKILEFGWEKIFTSHIFPYGFGFVGQFFDVFCTLHHVHDICWIHIPIGSIIDIISVNISYHVVRYEADERQDDVAGNLPQRGWFQEVVIVVCSDIMCWSLWLVLYVVILFLVCTVTCAILQLL